MYAILQRRFVLQKLQERTFLSNEDLFFKSFRREHFYQVLTAMQQVGNKSILCGRMGACIRNRGSMFFLRCLGFFPCLKNKSCRLSERADMREPALCHCSVIDSQCDPSSYLTGARSAHSHAQRIDLASARWPANVLRASSLRDRWPARPVGIQRATSPAHLPAQRASACRPPRPAALYGSEYAADSRTFWLRLCESSMEQAPICRDLRCLRPRAASRAAVSRVVAFSGFF